MSYNSNFNNFDGSDTFLNHQMFTSPPPIHNYPTAQQLSSDISDEDVIKQFESKIPKVPHVISENSVSISQVHDQIRNLVHALNKIKVKQKFLSEKINNLSDNEWSAHLKQTKENKDIVSKILSSMNSLNTDVLRKLLAKRCSKRARQKRQRIEKKKQKKELEKQKEENSRKIDEYLKKFQDHINKAKQEDEAKFQTDAVLKETIRKKQDAKRYIVKLDALIKLRKARMNTAKGRGETLSQKEAEVFEMNIEKLKSMWSQRLIMYDKEESELRVKLQQDCEAVTDGNETEKRTKHNLEQWKVALFGGELPQAQFLDVGAFLTVRSLWDRYLNPEGSSIPLGWALPTTT